MNKENGSIVNQEQIVQNILCTLLNCMLLWNLEEGWEHLCERASVVYDMTFTQSCIS